MHSLQKLRAENAAERLSQASDLSEAPPVSEAVTTTVGAPRVGRTLAPLTSTGSPLPAANEGENRNTSGGAEEDTTRQEDREARRQRRKYRQEREQQRNEGDNGGNDDTATSVATPASTVGKDKASIHFPGEGVIQKSAPDQTNGVRVDLNRERADTEATGGRTRAPLAARRAPPQEKPRKNLTPSAARRARIDQQKRQEVEREIGESPRGNALRLVSDSPRNNFEQETTPEVKGGAKSHNKPSASGRSGDRDSVRRPRVLGKNDSTPTRGEGAPGRTNPENEGKTGASEEAGEPNTEHYQLIPNAIGKDSGEGNKGNQSEKSENTQNEGGRGEYSDVLGNDEVEDATEGRFKVMRSRMNKAGKGLINTNQSAGFRRAKATGHTGLDIVSGDGDNTGTNEAGDGRNVSRKSSRGLQDGQGNSDTTSNDSIMSPLLSGAENGRIDGTDDGSDSDGENQRNHKWGLGKSSTDTAAGGDKEVTLGHVVDRKMREMGYIRKPAVGELKNRRSLRDRVAAEGAPEVHFIGEISGAEGFGPGISCRFRVEGGRHWTCLSGLQEGQTHVMHVGYGESFAPWNHPIDLHYTTKSIQGWPRLMLQVWQLDVHGRNVLRGYGFRHLPSTPGFSEVSVPCWRPTGTMQEETAVFFLGVTPRLVAEDAVFNRAWDQRCRLVTLPAGTVWIQMNGIFRNFHNQGIDSLPFS